MSGYMKEARLDIFCDVRRLPLARLQVRIRQQAMVLIVGHKCGITLLQCDLQKPYLITTKVCVLVSSLCE